MGVEHPPAADGFGRGRAVPGVPGDAALGGTTSPSRSRSCRSGPPTSAWLRYHVPTTLALSRRLTPCVTTATHTTATPQAAMAGRPSSRADAPAPSPRRCRVPAPSRREPRARAEPRAPAEPVHPEIPSADRHRARRATPSPRTAKPSAASGTPVTGRSAARRNASLYQGPVSDCASPESLPAARTNSPPRRHAFPRATTAPAAQRRQQPDEPEQRQRGGDRQPLGRSSSASPAACARVWRAGQSVPRVDAKRGTLACPTPSPAPRSRPSPPRSGRGAALPASGELPPGGQHHGIHGGGDGGVGMGQREPRKDCQRRHARVTAPQHVVLGHARDGRASGRRPAATGSRGRSARGSRRTAAGRVPPPARRRRPG